MSTQTIFRVVNPNKAYTKLSNVLLADTDLSFECKGFLVSILMLPTDWTFNVAWLKTKFGISKDAAYKLIKEAGQAGYCKKIETRRQNGTLAKVEYHFADDPADFLENKPLPENPEVEQPLPEKPEPAPATSGKSGRIQRELTATNNDKGNPPVSPPEGDKRTKRTKVALPEDWVLPDDWFDWAMRYADFAIADETIRKEGEQFADYWIGSGKRMVDWRRTWQRWWRTYCERNARRPYANGHAMTNFDRKIEGARRFTEMMDQIESKRNGHDLPRISGR